MPFDSLAPFKSPAQVTPLSLDFERANPPRTFHEALRRLIPWLRTLPPDFIWDFSQFDEPIYSPSSPPIESSHRINPASHCGTIGCAVGVANAIWTEANPLHCGGKARRDRNDSGVAQIWTDLFLKPTFYHLRGNVTKEQVADDIERYLATLDAVR